MEQLEHVDAERRGARDPDAQAPAEALLHLCEDEPVGDPFTHTQPCRDGLTRTTKTRRARADVEGPETELPLGALLVLDAVEDARMDLLVDPRDRRQDRRPHRAERLGDARCLR